jgi:hypothetical protein
MRRREQSPEKIALRNCWGRWTDIVEVFARRRQARKRIEGGAYVKLHREVVERCRLLAASANEVEKTFYSYLEDLARPWLDLAVLDRAERDILFDLLIRCQDAEKQLAGRTRRRSRMTGAKPAMLGAIIFVIVLLWTSRFSVLSSIILDHVRSLSDDFYFRVVHSSDLERLFVVGCLLVATSIYTVSRTAKS